MHHDINSSAWNIAVNTAAHRAILNYCRYSSLLRFDKSSEKPSKVASCRLGRSCHPRLSRLPASRHLRQIRTNNGVTPRNWNRFDNGNSNNGFCKRKKNAFQKPSCPIHSFPSAKQTIAHWRSKMRFSLSNFYYEFAGRAVGNYGLHKTGREMRFLFYLEKWQLSKRDLKKTPTHQARSNKRSINARKDSFSSSRPSVITKPSPCF